MLFFIPLFLLFLSFCDINSDSNTFCGSHLISRKRKKEIITNSKHKKTKIPKRNLESEDTPINIILDNTYMLSQLNQLRNVVDIDTIYPLISQALETAVSMLKSLILVEKNGDLITLDKDDIIEKCYLNSYGYNSNYLSPNQIESNTIIIYPRFHDFKQGGKNKILSSASYCAVDSDTNRPLAGYIFIEQNITINELRKDNKDKYFALIFLHELTHILVFDEVLFQQNVNINKKIKQIEILNQNRKIIYTPRVLEMAKRHFGCEGLEGIEFENQDYEWKDKENEGGNVGDDNDEDDNFEAPTDIYGNHWDARTMLTDYMTSVYYDEMVISEITLALFEDSGWYKVNYYTGGLFRYGKNQGCEFLNSYCVYGDISLHKNEFCIKEATTMCTPGRTHRGMCGLMSYPVDLEINYRYFTNSRKGGFLPQADYCPIAKTNSSVSKTYFYQGHCSYGEIEYYPESLGYEMGEDSICLLSSLTPKNIESLKEYPSSFRALCFKVECKNNTEKSVRIFIGNNVIDCPASGGPQTLEGYNGYILCPDYNLVCTGTKWCIDPFTCIDIQSEPSNDSFIYDYSSITSQEYQEFLNYKVPTKDEITLFGRYFFINTVLIFIIFILML